MNHIKIKESISMEMFHDFINLLLKEKNILNQILFHTEKNGNILPIGNDGNF